MRLVPPKAALRRGPTMAGRCCRAALIGILTITETSPAAAPSIDSVTVERSSDGKSAKLIVAGTDLDSATALWTSLGVIQPAGEVAEKRAIFRLASVPPAGVFAVRLFASNGVSGPHFFMIDDLPGVAESRTNKNRAAAQPLDIGSSVEGVCDELGFDWFKFHASKGERVAIEVVASRLGSRLDSILRVTDAGGRQIANVDDVPGLRGDSYISVSVTNTGDYFVELRDVNYGGGSEFFYRLRTGDFPLATTTFPLATTRAAETTFALSGPAGFVGEKRAFLSPNAPAGFVFVGGRKGTTFAKTLIAPNAEATEHEPNDRKPAQAIQLFHGISGRFDKANDRDTYEFTARKGERLEFRALTRSVGSACDVAMRVESEKGAELARSNPTTADEGVVNHKFGNDGRYRLVVEEISRSFGPNCVYRIVMQRAAGFSLTIETDRVNVARGKTFELKVTCARGDYKGPVTVAVDGVAGLTITNNVIAEGKTNITMKITAPESLATGAPAFLNVSGSAERDGSTVHVRASTAPALRRKFPQTLYVPVELDGEIALGITAK